jgi:hypothetical protein
MNTLEKKQAIAAILAAIKQLNAIRKSAEGWDTGIEIADLRKTLRNLRAAEHQRSPMRMPAKSPVSIKRDEHPNWVHRLVRRVFPSCPSYNFIWTLSIITVYSEKLAVLLLVAWACSFLPA